MIDTKTDIIYRKCIKHCKKRFVIEDMLINVWLEGFVTELLDMKLWILATFAAFYIKGLCGFANTLVFTSVMGFGASNVNISPTELILGYPTNIILVWKNRKKLQKGIYMPLAVMVLLGSIPGTFMLKNINAQHLKVAFGVVVVILALDMAVRQSSSTMLKKSRIILLLVGLVSGVLCGLFGVGVLLAVYIGHVTENSSEFKANLSAVFIADNTFRIIMYSVIGVITETSMKLALYMMPFMLLGLFAGMKSSQYLDEKIARKLVIVLLIVSGVALVVKNI